MESLSKIPGGMRYHFGRGARLRRAVEAEAMSVFDGWGYEEIATPAVDYYALFERGMGRDEARRAFRFTDTDGRMLALRPDVTSSVARAAATLFASAARPLRFCYAESVFRQRPPSHAEWKRQGRQVGCELIGAGGVGADLEILAVAAEVLERLGLRSRFCVTVNHVGVFNGLAAQLGLDEGERELMRRLVDARDAEGLEDLLARRAGGGATPALAARLARLSGKREALEAARGLVSHESTEAALAALEQVWETVEALGLADSFEVDLGDVSGLDYYTGLIFKIYLEGAGARVGGGGRYDELTANFGTREPAVGFVLDLDAITEVLAGRDAGQEAVEDEAAAVVEAGGVAERLREAKGRRARGERVRISLGGA
jgi:ATP phosphoribosyltransferase regulatory subunit